MTSTSYRFHYRAATASSRRTVSRAHVGELGDILTFLAVAHDHALDIASITWDLHLSAIGEGGTAQISQREINLQWSLAFKRPAVTADRSERLDNEYQVLISETLVLCDAATRNHPNIVTLEGVCWDFNPETHIAWPVLIFEKAQEGDLGSFISSDAGVNMAFSQRLQLCQDIARALTNLHSYGMLHPPPKISMQEDPTLTILRGIIHGDINPRNILIFKEGEHYYAKLSDFGYSAVMSKTDFIDMAKTRPWNAPECDTTWRFDFKGARLTDIYSLGLLSLWILFYEVSPAPSKQIRTSKVYDIGWIKTLRENEQLKTFAASQISMLGDVPPTQRAKLSQFFNLALTEDPEKRVMYVDGLFHEYEQYGGQIDEHAPDFIKANVTEVDLRLEYEIPYALMFQLSKVWWQIMIGDFRVWGNIFESLMARTSPHLDTSYQAHAAFQLAFCYRIGFGCRRSLSDSSYWLNRSNNSIDDLEEEVKLIRSKQGRWHIGMISEFETPRLDEAYERCGILAEAKVAYGQAIMGLENTLDSDHRILLTLKVRLADILNKESRHSEAKALLLSLVGCSMNGPSSMTVKSSLSMTHYYMSDFVAMESSLLEELAFWRYEEKRGSELLSYNRIHRAEGSILNLLKIAYVEQGKYDEAVAALLQRIKIIAKDYGEAHAKTLEAKQDLAAVYVRSGKLHGARRLLKEAISTAVESLGEFHPEVLQMENLLSRAARTRRERKEAELTALHNLETCKQILGDTHEVIQNTNKSLATLLDNQGRYHEAFKWRELLFVTNRKILGASHPQTASAMSALAVSYFNIGDLDRSESLQASALDILKKELGEWHPVTRHSARLLAHDRRLARIRTAAAIIVPRNIIAGAAWCASRLTSWILRVYYYFH